MNVEQIMTRLVKTCSPDDSLDTAAGLMWDHDFGCVPVIDEQERCVGVITDRDICMAAYTQGQRLGDIRVRAAMSGACHTAGPHDPVASAERTMQDNEVRRLPVVDEVGRVVGIVSLADITCEAARESNSKRGDVTLEEVAVTLSAVSRPRNGGELQPVTATRRRTASGAVAMR